LKSLNPWKSNDHARILLRFVVSVGYWLPKASCRQSLVMVGSVAILTESMQSIG
ncbi:hypothetical protein BAE44_0026033, partial [Dichanthelium oligosanthes]